ncbi:MAG: acyl-CoA--6-aminopenicillanic acid acyltransferase [Bacteroidetes bacterium]|nr:acyl-CoA--6-aminopenicillanic acid acyltransferase [Bacteroidota bacterium]
MCDTFVNVPGKGHPVIFGKNSDREPNEAQQIVRYPRNTRKEGKVNATYIQVNSPIETFEVILSKPFQMWGAEMGANEHGVAIGNEAVFTKVKIQKKNNGLTGMDLLRLALESSETAKKALHNIIDNLEQYGQDASGGYTDKRFFYHNSFIVADPSEAYVLETAGKHWAWKKVSGYRAISNGLSIEDDYDEISKDAIDFADEKGWAKVGETFSFRKAFASFWMPRLAACDARRSLSEKRGKAVLDWNVGEAFRILRSHGKEPFNPAKGKTTSVCMHASGKLCPSQTTGSMVAELRPNGKHSIWLTGTSAPCLSIYKPFYFGTSVLNESNLIIPTAQVNDAYWWQWEAFHRRILMHYKKYISQIRRDQGRLETKWIEQDWFMHDKSVEEQATFSTECLDATLEVLEEWKDTAGFHDSYGKYFYRRFWMKQNSKV